MRCYHYLAYSPNNSGFGGLSKKETFRENFLQGGREQASFIALPGSSQDRAHEGPLQMGLNRLFPTLQVRGQPG